MKVWLNYRDGGYWSGMILVVANSAEEAHKVFHADENYKWMWDDFRWCNAGFEDYYYHPDGWKLMPVLEANVDKPQVLAEAGRSE